MSRRRILIVTCDSCFNADSHDLALASETEFYRELRDQGWRFQRDAAGNRTDTCRSCLDTRLARWVERNCTPPDDAVAQKAGH